MEKGNQKLPFHFIKIDTDKKQKQSNVTSSFLLLSLLFFVPFIIPCLLIIIVEREKHMHAHCFDIFLLDKYERYPTDNVLFFFFLVEVPQTEMKLMTKYR